MSRERVMIFDTTLRDGEQSPGCSMAQPEKLRVARARGPENGVFIEDVLDWISRARDASAHAVRERLRAWIPEYAPARGPSAHGDSPVSPSVGKTMASVSALRTPSRRH